MQKITHLVIILFLILAIRPALFGQEKRGTEIPLPEIDPRGEWFQQAKLGVFLHWGMYAVGGQVSNRLNYPTRPDVFIPWDTYFAQAKTFKAEKYDPAAWVRTFREVGARYVVITTKHHDGFALWDSQAPGALTAVNGSAAGRDLLTPFVEAMRADHMPVGLYFSVSDWHHPDYASMKPRPGSTQTVTTAPLAYAETDQPERWKKFQDFMFAQIGELMKFKPAIWWFDGIWERTHENWRGPEIAEMIARDNPAAILGRGWQFDAKRELMRYQTPEQAIPLATPKGLWELCQTTNESWAYNPADTKWKSAGQLVQIFTEVISRGGNLLLNVGPKADGTLPEESIGPMLKLGAWIKRNADAIYPTFGGEQAGTSFKCFFGPSTVSMDGKTLYLFVDSFPEHGIQVRGIYTVPKKISVVSTGEDIKVQWFGGNGVDPRTYTIMPPKTPDPLCTVIKLEFNQVIRISRKAGELQEGEL